MQRPALLVLCALALPVTVAVSHRASATAVTSASLPDLGPVPELTGGTGWLNGPPLRTADLRGRVLMIEVWTFGCYNCLNALPHVKETAARYRDAGLVTIGVHTPETERERVTDNVRRRVQELGVRFPVVLDNDFAIWRALGNQYWPSIYLVDRRGRIRFHHDGEGRYGAIDAAVKQLLAEPIPAD